LKKNVEKIIFKIWVKYMPCPTTVGGFLLCNQRVKRKRQAVKLVKFIFFKKKANPNATETSDKPVPNT